MSFHIGFAMEDLVILAGDRRCRKYNYEGIIEKDILDIQKLHFIKKNIYGIGDGWAYFSRRWVSIIKRCPFLNKYLFRMLGPIIHYDYILQRIISRKASKTIKAIGESNILLGGFISGKAFLCCWNSVDRFKTSFFDLGYTHAELLDLRKDEYVGHIKQIGILLFAMRKDTIEKRKTFLRHAMGKLFNYLNSKTPESISANADMVFITPEGSVMESLNTCPMTLDHPGREMINVGNLLKRRNRDLCR